MKDKIPNTETLKKFAVRPISEKMRMQRLRWYGHVERRPDTYCAKVAEAYKPPGKRKKGRPEKRWIDSINEDMRLLNLTKDDVHDRLKWSLSTKMADPTWEECL